MRIIYVFYLLLLTEKIMDLKEAQNYANSKIGLRCKQKPDGILIYGNAWTITVDVCKWIKLKFNKFICL